MNNTTKRAIIKVLENESNLLIADLRRLMGVRDDIIHDIFRYDDELRRKTFTAITDNKGDNCDSH